MNYDLLNGIMGLLLGFFYYSGIWCFVSRIVRGYIDFGLMCTTYVSAVTIISLVAWVIWAIKGVRK